MKKIISVTIKLFLITAVSAGLLGVVNAVTREPIAQQMEKAATEARLAAFPGAASFEDSGALIPEEYSIITNVFNALDEDGNVIGATLGLTARGYSSGLKMTVGIGADGTIKGVVVGDNNETPSIGKKALGPDFLGQFSGKPYDNPLKYVKSASGDYDIEAVSGATVTTKAFTNAVNTAVEFYKQLGGVK